MSAPVLFRVAALERTRRIDITCSEFLQQPEVFIPLVDQPERSITSGRAIHHETIDHRQFIAEKDRVFAELTERKATVGPIYETQKRIRVLMKVQDVDREQRIYGTAIPLAKALL